MRKFNLKGNVAKKLMGIDPEKAAPVAQPRSGGMPDETGEGRDFTTGMGTDENRQGVGAVRMTVAWRTDVGRLRKNNQDAVILGNGLVGVADGMGGHNGGEIASARLRDGLIREIADQKPGEAALRAAVEKVNDELWTCQEEDASLTGMGTTLTVLWPAEKEMIIGHVGDSRAYLIRDGEMKQITSDHSLVADMVREGVLTEEQAACHPMRNYITRAVGTETTIDVDMISVPRRRGDRWLICSDGLHGQMDRTKLRELALESDLEKAADALLQEALDQGGRDNISLILLQDNDAPEYDPADSEQTMPAGIHDPAETEGHAPETAPSEDGEVAE